MALTKFLDKNWHIICKNNNLNSFDSFWALPEDFVDEVNTRGKGWSSVSKYDLNSIAKTLFVKRQENYLQKTLTKPLQGQNIAANEYKNLKKLDKISDLSIKPIFFSENFGQGKQQTVLATEGLDGYLPLDSLYAACIENNITLSYQKRKQLIAAVARAVAQLHNLGCCHGCLYPKHIFVKTTIESFDIKFIDLEKGYWPPFFLLASGRKRDLTTLDRRTPGWPLKDKLYFLSIYQQYFC